MTSPGVQSAEAILGPEAWRPRRDAHQARGAALGEASLRDFRILAAQVAERVSGQKLDALLQAAELIVKSALHRKESRGLHYTLDYPELADEAKDTVLVP